jgi:predicted AAA+ superfamily ATPase
MYIKRDIETNIENWLFKGKVIVLYGARQVGKTTLVKKFIEKHGTSESYIDCENLSVQNALKNHDAKSLRSFLGDGNFFVLDEAQRVENIGVSLKLLIDTYPELQIIATGSSSFDLSNKIIEPLTGRSIIITLYSLSLNEIVKNVGQSSIKFQINRCLRFGGYPGIFNSDEKNSITLLNNIASNYLYKDILMFESLRKSDLIVQLMQLLAFQVGNEVSLSELAIKLQTSKQTISRYIDLLEKAFVIFHLRPLSRNLRNEIGKKNKIYFYDLGIRNALVGNFNDINARNDLGALWENFCVVERKKYLERNEFFRSIYFWRNHLGQEIDYVEEYNGQFDAYEFKWSEESVKFPRPFKDSYLPKNTRVVNKNNWRDFLI